MSLEFRNVLLCEHIVQEIQNKYSLIGVYSGDVNVKEFPSQIRLAVYTELKTDGREKFQVKIDIRLNGESFLKGSADIVSAQTGAAAFATPNFVATIISDTTVEIFLSVDDDIPRQFSKKTITKAPAV